jgi:hypothetical protein
MQVEPYGYSRVPTWQVASDGWSNLFRRIATLGRRDATAL